MRIVSSFGALGALAAGFYAYCLVFWFQSVIDLRSGMELWRASFYTYCLVVWLQSVIDLRSGMGLCCALGGSRPDSAKATAVFA